MRSRDKNPICGIYKITSPTGRVYIGKSVNIFKRFDSYRFVVCKSQPILFRSIEKYGWSNHEKEIIEMCCEEQLNEREMFWIGYFDSHKKGMNCTGGGEGAAGYIWTEEQKLKHSERLRGVMLGDKNPFFGRLHSEETKIKISDKNKGRKMGEEEKARKIQFLKKNMEENGHPSIGIKQSSEHIEKRVKKNTGKKRTEESKKRQSLAAMGNQRWLGRKHTPERNEKFKNWWRTIKETDWYNSDEQKAIRKNRSKKAIVSKAQKSNIEA